MIRSILLLPVLFTLVFVPGLIPGPSQPEAGPGGMEYGHDSVRMSAFAEEADGYWLFEPESPRPDSAPVVVFHHGYGAFNTMIYGGWIRHLVRRGNIVIFPRYQMSLVKPSSKEFPENAATAIRNALVRLDTGDHVRPVTEPFAMVGHSYGGAISAYLAVNYEQYGIPQPKAVMACAPGTGPFNGALLDSYEAMPPDTRLLVIVNENDHVVGDKLGNLIYETAVHTPRRNLLRQFPDDYGEPGISASHNQAYSLYEPFDNGHHNLSYKRALRSASTDAMDYYGYWKLFDALLDCTRKGEHCNYAFGDTPEQRSLGEWADGKKVKELEVVMPGE